MFSLIKPFLSALFWSLTIAVTLTAQTHAAKLDVSWPLVHGDAENSDFVALAGPRDLVPEWRALQVRPAASFVAVGPAGQLVTTSMDAGPCHLHVLNPDGSIRWCSDAVRTAFAAPTVDSSGGVLVSDGTEVFRFKKNGQIDWIAPAFERALAGVFVGEDHILFIGARGMATVYDVKDGAVAAQLTIPAGLIPRPDPLPQSLALFKIGAPAVGFDPDPAFLDYFIDAFSDFNVVVGNNIPAVAPESGRVFIAVSANPDLSGGIMYGLDFEPPTGSAAGQLSIGCSAPLGLASATSPTVSLDGQRVYAGDSTGVFRAFDVDTCDTAWTLALPAPSLASPGVGLDGRLFLLVNSKIVGIKDNVTDAEVLWETDIGPLAQSLGFTTGRFNSTIASTPNYLYSAASYFVDASGTLVPVAHAVAVVNALDGQIVSTATLGEESDAVVSLGPDGKVYVASKPLNKAILTPTPAAPLLPPPQSGIFAFAPASYKQLTEDGIAVCWDFINRAQQALDDALPETAIVELERAQAQQLAAEDNYRTALDRDELTADESRQIKDTLKTLDRTIRSLR